MTHSIVVHRAVAEFGMPAAGTPGPNWKRDGGDGKDKPCDPRAYVMPRGSIKGSGQHPLSVSFIKEIDACNNKITIFLEILTLRCLKLPCIVAAVVDLLGLSLPRHSLGCFDDGDVQSAIAGGADHSGRAIAL